MLTANQVYTWIDQRAPFITQMDSDNAGFLVGNPLEQVKGIHVALDATMGVVQKAVACGANLIVTHHPLMFTGRKNMRETDWEGAVICRMIRERMCLISAHTNLDQAEGGINDALAEVIGLKNVTGTGYCRTGTMPGKMTGEEFAVHLAKVLHTQVRPMGNMQRQIRRVTVASGAGSDEWEEMLRADSDAFVTGEMKHHHGLAIAESGHAGYECGHFATEKPGIFALADALQIWINELEYSVKVTKSVLTPYQCPMQSSY